MESDRHARRPAPARRARRARAAGRGRRGPGRGRSSGSVAGQVAMQERLEVAVGRRQPRRLLDLERRARGRRAGPRPDASTMRCAASARRGRDPLRAGLVARARGEERPPTASASSARPDSCAADRRAGEDRAQVADRVAPALVELTGLDDDVGERRRPGAAADRDDGGRAPGVAGGLERGVRGGRPALVRDADDEPARRRVQGQLECLGRADVGVRGGRPPAPPRGGSRRPRAPRARRSRSR